MVTKVSQVCQVSQERVAHLVLVEMTDCLVFRVVKENQVVLALMVVQAREERTVSVFSHVKVPLSFCEHLLFLFLFCFQYFHCF